MNQILINFNGLLSNLFIAMIVISILCALFFIITIPVSFDTPIPYLFFGIFITVGLPIIAIYFDIRSQVDNIRLKFNTDSNTNIVSIITDLKQHILNYIKIVGIIFAVMFVLMIISFYIGLAPFGISLFVVFLMIFSDCNNFIKYCLYKSRIWCQPNNFYSKPR